MNNDTKDHLKRDIATLDKMIKALDTEIRFNKEASQKFCAAFNRMRIASDNLKAALIEVAPAFVKLNEEIKMNFAKIGKIKSGKEIE